MGIREKLNENPAYTTGGTIAIIVIALGFIVWQLIPTRQSVPTKAYFSDDDGATYFADDIKNIAPYDHNGKPAVKAYVFKCSGGSKFVGYLEKYAPAARQRLVSAQDKPANMVDPAMQMAAASGLLVKKPGAGNWVSERQMPAYQAVIAVKCPDGSGDVEPIMP